MGHEVLASEFFINELFPVLKEYLGILNDFEFCGISVELFTLVKNPPPYSPLGSQVIFSDTNHQSGGRYSKVTHDSFCE
jgi:hypothetical protein